MLKRFINMTDSRHKPCFEARLPRRGSAYDIRHALSYSDVLGRFLFVISLVSALSSVSIASEKTPASTSLTVQVSELPQLWASLSNTKKIHIFEELMRAGKLDMFERLLAQTRFDHAGGKFEATFYHAMLNKYRGAYKPAITGFRSLLANQPGLHRVRLELAHALFLQKEDDSAKHHFELLTGSNANPQLNKIVSGYLDAIKRRRRWSMSAYASLAPGSMVQAKSQYVTILVAGVPQRFKVKVHQKKGVGANGGFNAGYRYALSDRFDLMLGGGTNMRKYHDSRFDEINVSGEFGPRYNFAKGHIGLFGTVGHSWFGGHHGKKTQGLRLHGGYRLGRKNILSSDLSCYNKRYDIARYLDGHYCSAESQLNHYFSTQSFMTLKGGVVQDTAKSKHESYLGGKSAVGFYYELPMGLTTHSQLTYQHRQYEAVYPVMGKERRDDQIDTTLSLTKRDWELYGFAPKAQYSYTKNLSNIPFLAYDAHNFNLTLTKQF